MPSEEKIHKAAAVIVEGYMNVPLAEYLRLIMIAVWEENEQFSGKRPLGHSGWQFDVYKALVKAGLISGTIDADGDLGQVDQKEGDELVLAVIKRLVIKSSDYVDEPMHQRMGL